MPALLVFSHLRWDFVTQRPQHLMRRFARTNKVWFWEEPIGCDHPLPYLEHHHFPDDGVTALRPRLPHWWSPEERERGLASLLDHFIASVTDAPPVLWYYTPLMLGFSRQVEASAVVYDCMDELSAFAHADPALIDSESALLARADVVFTGGTSLYEAKRDRHRRVFAFPSAVDVEHFRGARRLPKERTQPVLGYIGVIDERLDLPLIAALAKARPDWRIEMVGPVVKIDQASLPQADNLHWLGPRSYADLPGVLAGWDVALMPFALNEATRFISPTKTPEYLAAGRPVVSTPIRDVVSDYGALTGVWIAKDAAAFAAACDQALALAGGTGAWREAVDTLLADKSWDRTQARMAALVAESVEARAHGTALRLVRPEPEPEAAYDVLIVGAGFAGAVMAERLARDAGKRVLIIDRRDHIGGNAYDEFDAAGVLIHRYGPHIFHTNSDEVFDYLSRFTAWRPYEHRVKAQVGTQLVPMPINRTTIEQLYGVRLDDDAQTAAWLAARAEPVEDVQTSRDVVVAAVGTELYETFFEGYTRKQWGLDPSELDKSVTSRVPTRTDRDDRYFQDKHQAMPLAGYTEMFRRMLDHPLITVRTGVDYRDVIDTIAVEQIVYTGPIDEFFDHRFGKLPYRSLQFVNTSLDVERAQDAAVINYPDASVPFTRVTEYKWLTGQQHDKTTLCTEYPRAEGDPYYPIPRPASQALFRKYQALADATPNVIFVGRLANYRYYNMDQVVGQALANYRKHFATPDAHAAKA